MSASVVTTLMVIGALLTGTACATVPAYPETTVEVVPVPEEEPVEEITSEEEFGPALEPYGTWVDVDGVGRAWQPSRAYVGLDFRPYATGGYWVQTRAGWTFRSSYPFGWAVFHYGRWWQDPYYGWVWVPGTVWGPAWVDWYSSGGYVGWAPLPPAGYYVGPSYWFYVSRSHWGRRDYYRHIHTHDRIPSRYRAPTRYVARPAPARPTRGIDSARPYEPGRVRPTPGRPNTTPRVIERPRPGSPGERPKPIPRHDVSRPRAGSPGERPTPFPRDVDRPRPQKSSTERARGMIERPAPVTPRATPATRPDTTVRAKPRTPSVERPSRPVDTGRFARPSPGQQRQQPAGRVQRAPSSPRPSSGATIARPSTSRPSPSRSAIGSPASRPSGSARPTPSRGGSR